MSSLKNKLKHKKITHFSKGNIKTLIFHVYVHGFYDEGNIRKIKVRIHKWRMLHLDEIGRAVVAIVRLPLVYRHEEAHWSWFPYLLCFDYVTK